MYVGEWYIASPPHTSETHPSFCRLQITHICTIKRFSDASARPELSSWGWSIREDSGKGTGKEVRDTGVLYVCKNNGNCADDCVSSVTRRSKFFFNRWNWLLTSLCNVLRRGGRLIIGFVERWYLICDFVHSPILFVGDNVLVYWYISVYIYI